MTKHPETGTRFEWDQSVDCFVVRTISKIEGRTIYTHEGGNWGTVDEFRDGIASGDIRNVISPSASPASGPACKAPEWCGFYRDESKRTLWHSLKTYPIHWSGHCSEACLQRSETPPLESKPAETGKAGPIRSGSAMCCPLGYLDKGHSGWCKSAQPAQEAPKVPVCADCLDSNDSIAWRIISDGPPGRTKRVLTCAKCHLSFEAMLYRLGCLTNAGTPYAGPERLSKAKLAHVGGMHDDDLVGR